MQQYKYYFKFSCLNPIMDGGGGGDPNNLGAYLGLKQGKNKKKSDKQIHANNIAI